MDKNRIIRLIFSIILIICVQSSQAQIIINEFLCSNSSGLLNSETGQFHDWIEFYNTDSDDIDLGGYYLSDNDKDPLKWSFPPNSIIEGNGYLIIYPNKLDYKLNSNFALSRDGEELYLTSSDGDLLDFIVFGEQKPDVSYGRDPNNPAQWGWFGEPTPGKENLTAMFQRPSENKAPLLSPDAGFFSNTIEVVAESPGNETGVIRYTIDGSIPTSTSSIFPRILLIDKSTTVRIRLFSSSKMPSKVITKTYFVGEETTLPVFSISLNPDYLWDDNTGIYVDGSSFNGDRDTRNCCQTDWERPVNIEFFENNGELQFSEEAGVQVKGRMNCEFPKKPLGIYFRSKYGKNKVNYSFFEDKAVGEFSSFILRPGGADGMGDCYNGTMIRDGLLSSLLIGQMDIDYEAFRPAILFINGEYWGIHNIRERNKSDYLASNHGVDPDNLDLLENPANGGIIEGDDIHYQETLDLLAGGDMTSPDVLEQVKQRIDVQELLNYQIAEIFVNNEDWAHNNVLCWRPRTDTGKWRWVFFDVEGGFGLYGDDDYNNNLFGFKQDPFLKHANLFDNLLDNPSIEADFVQGFAAHLNSTFHPDRVITMINSMSQQILNEMPKDILRWGDQVTNGGSGCTPINSIDQWESHLAIMKNFARQRPAVIRQQILHRYHLSGMSELTIENEGGTITLNGVEDATSGSYFNDLPIRLKAIPQVGFDFVEWKGISSDEEITISLTEDLTVTAIFVENGASILPSIITKDLILDHAGSPYRAHSDIIVERNATLRVGPDVEIIMPENASIYIYGVLQIIGQADKPVQITSGSTENKPWGSIVFDEAQEGSSINNLEISKASLSHQNPALFKANLNIINTYVPIDGLIIPDAKENGVFIFGAEAQITRSSFHCLGTGDYINIAASPGARIESNIFYGNDAPDTDAIDLDAVGPSSVVNNKFRNFHGLNSDGLDVGYSNEVLIEGNVFSSISDKGISVGSGSKIKSYGNLFLNCENGFGIKDEGSAVEIDRNTFFGNEIAINCFEKEPGRGGGNAQVVNSILAGVDQAASFADAYSSVSFDYSWDENSELPGMMNQKGDPGFVAPHAGVFRLSKNSACREAGDPNSEYDPDGTPADMGAFYFHHEQLSGIFLNEVIRSEKEITLEVYNNNDYSVSLNQLFLSSGSLQSDVLPLSDWANSNQDLPPLSFSLFNIPANQVNFKKNGDILILSQHINDEKIVLSSLPFSSFLDNFSYGSFPDGTYSFRHFAQKSPGSSNQAGPSGQGQIFINEILADNKNSIADEENQYEDWLELYNAGSDDFILQDMYLTDDLSNPTKNRVSGSLENYPLIESKGFIFYWADGSPEAGDNHLNFKLDAKQEEIGLFRVMYPDTLLIDSLLFSDQTSDISIGRFPDGSNNIIEFDNLTPGESNVSLLIRDDNDIFDLTIYPNPFTDRLNIRIKGVIGSKTSIEIINIQGQIIRRMDLSPASLENNLTIGVEELTSGLYIVRVISSAKVRTARIIKQ